MAAALRRGTSQHCCAAADAPCHHHCMHAGWRSKVGAAAGHRGASLRACWLLCPFLAAGCNQASTRSRATPCFLQQGAWARHALRRAPATEPKWGRARLSSPHGRPCRRPPVYLSRERARCSLADANAWEKVYREIQGGGQAQAVRMRFRTMLLHALLCMPCLLLAGYMPALACASACCSGAVLAAACARHTTLLWALLPAPSCPAAPKRLHPVSVLFHGCPTEQGLAASPPLPIACSASAVKWPMLCIQLPACCQLPHCPKGR